MTRRQIITGILSPHLSRRPIVLAAVVAALIVICTIILAPFGARPGPVVPPFVSMYAVLMSLIEGLTAYFLAIQFRSTREPLLGALAGAFGFVTVMVFAQMLVFPGVFSAKGLFTGNQQTSICIWALWHSGFPAIVLLGLMLHGTPWFQAREELGRQIGVWLIPGGPWLGIVLSYFCIGHAKMLPVLIAGGSYQRLHHSPFMAVIIGTTLVALIVCLCVTRLRNLLSLWLAIALLGSLSDAALTLSGAVRYDLGWYGGRTVGFISASLIFCVLVFELSQMYDRVLMSNRDLARRAARDGLTNAFNRGYFEEQFPREVRRAGREATALSLLLLDVDHFKTYNDLCGHQKGDECLIAIVDTLQKLTRRPGDFVARYGGEEFVVLLPRTDHNGALCLANEIRDAINAIGLPRGDIAAGIVTASLGIATLDPAQPPCTPDELLGRADQALYEAKRSGRDTARAFAPAATPDAPGLAGFPRPLGESA